MSPRRWTPNIRVWAYRYLALRDGEQCAICHALPTTRKQNRPRTDPLVSPTTQNTLTTPDSTTQNQNELRTTPIVSSTPQFTLDIDHIDGNPRNNHPGNLRLLCRQCNVAASNSSNPRKRDSSDLREREKRGSSIHTNC